MRSVGCSAWRRPARRWCDSQVYDRRQFTCAGFKHYDMYFMDGGTPTEAILRRFMEAPLDPNHTQHARPHAAHSCRASCRQLGGECLIALLCPPLGVASVSAMCVGAVRCCCLRFSGPLTAGCGDRDGRASRALQGGARPHRHAHRLLHHEALPVRACLPACLPACVRARLPACLPACLHYSRWCLAL